MLVHIYGKGQLFTLPIIRQAIARTSGWIWISIMQFESNAFNKVTKIIRPTDDVWIRLGSGAAYCNSPSMCVVGRTQGLAFFRSKDSGGVTIYYWTVNTQTLEWGMRLWGSTSWRGSTYSDTDAISGHNLSEIAEKRGFDSDMKLRNRPFWTFRQVKSLRSTCSTPSTSVRSNAAFHFKFLSQLAEPNRILEKQKAVQVCFPNFAIHS